MDTFVMPWPSILLVLTLASIAIIYTRTAMSRNRGPIKIRPSNDPDAPVSVNYFPSRQCNYACGFCFHTATTSYVLPIEEAKRGLKLLREAGMRKLNIAGGEPFLLRPRFLTEILRYCKEDLELESISIISNGSLIKESWIRSHRQWLDILAISCDSFNAKTNVKIGRGTDGQNVTRLVRIADWCREHGIMFKLNTVVNSFNWDEDMAANIERLAPFRWKVFQCLIVAGENDRSDRKRDATKFLVTEEQWQTFCNRHKHLKCYVPEDNNAMASSYLLIDEYFRLMDKGEGMVTTSESILKVGVKAAMQEVKWDTNSFVSRGGIYDWSKQQSSKAEYPGASPMGEKREKLDW